MFYAYVLLIKSYSLSPWKYREQLEKTFPRDENGSEARGLMTMCVYEHTNWLKSWINVN